MSELVSNLEHVLLKQQVGFASDRLAPTQNASQVRSPFSARVEELTEDLVSGNILRQLPVNSDGVARLIRYLSQRLGITESTARFLVQKGAVFSKGSSTSMGSIKQAAQEFFAKYVTQEENLTPPQTEAGASQAGRLAPEQTSGLSADLVRNQLRYAQQAANLAEFNILENHREVSNQLAKVEDLRNHSLGIEQLLPLLSAAVKSPKAFASLLVNNKTAFVLLKSNPELSFYLIALANLLDLSKRQVTLSPLFLAEIAKLITQILKLKQGSSEVTIVEEGEVSDRVQEGMLETSDHKSALVNNIRETISYIPSKAVRDFLLEAERFAEEEVANLWSLTLKKEKEIKKQIQSQFSNFK